MSTRETYKRDLEALLDGGHTVSDILSMLAEVCDDKADHIEDNWQDDTTAKVWRKLSVRLANTSNQVHRHYGI
ncbi:hypothetical protein [Taklimakanibacter albus]|uniref:Uncharacterized protein n=1 Tax=Taklimakanibacter albus TaxID=2800327 RepID=A0ACC5RG10_9HYPH|nr:hypothetical protein [Aestuariivirga sp. YIM B02566]MBK1871584.1 hypothetical protein [Aestuariivirga sp. YIM B02566]